jgi:hypothetical protein
MSGRLRIRRTSYECSIFVAPKGCRRESCFLSCGRSKLSAMPYVMHNIKSSFCKGHCVTNRTSLGSWIRPGLNSASLAHARHTAPPYLNLARQPNPKTEADLLMPPISSAARFRCNNTLLSWCASRFVMHRSCKFTFQIKKFQVS